MIQTRMNLKEKSLLGTISVKMHLMKKIASQGSWREREAIYKKEEIAKEIIKSNKKNQMKTTMISTTAALSSQCLTHSVISKTSFRNKSKNKKNSKNQKDKKRNLSLTIINIGRTTQDLTINMTLTNLWMTWSECTLFHVLCLYLASTDATSFIAYWINKLIHMVA